MKMINLALLGFVVSSLSHAALIENGSSFTGKYKVQEASCEKSIFNYQTGQYDLVPYFDFVGTPEGLKMDGRLQQVQKGNPQQAQPNSGVTTNADYLSSFEFRVDGATHFERDGVIPAAANFSQDYTVDTLGNITLVTTDTNGRPADNMICHFTRLN